MNTETTNDHAEAWAFVLRHTKMMERLAYRFGPRSHGDRDEWMRDVFIRVVEKHHKYDSEKSAPQTWIVWQMRAVTTEWTRRFHKRCREGYGSTEAMTMTAIDPTKHGSVEHSQESERHEDATAMASVAYSNANKQQRIAIRTFLSGMTATELRKRHGMTGRERSAHLRELRAYME